MIRHLFLGALTLAVLVAPSLAEERRKVSPIVLQSRWLGLPGAKPADCKVDGFMVDFGTTDGKEYLMGVRQRVNGVAPMDARNTTYFVIDPPANAPTRLEIFLEATVNGKKSRLGIDVLTGSAIEIVPEGDGTYPATSLFLMRCG